MAGTPKIPARTLFSGMCAAGLVIFKILKNSRNTYFFVSRNTMCYNYYLMRKRNDRYELTNTKYLLDAELEHLKRTLEHFKDKDSRNCTLLWTALHTGGRAQEILNIQAEDLDHTEQTVFIRGLKDSDNRNIPVPPWLFKRLAALAPPSGRVFPFTYNRFRQIWQMYRPVKKKLHSLRHTFAIGLYRKTRDLRLLQVALGHRNWNNTMIYAAYHFKNDELRKAILG